ncbi:MAG: electron transfer flavoprotein subunit beta/FixA family protein [Elusimicrobiota bacterium]
MALNIFVCVKRTPASTSVALDSQTGQVKTQGLPHAINPLDEYAVEEALRIKEKVAGSKVCVLSAGGPESDQVVRAALSVGCDEGVLVSDPAFAGSDTWASSHILSRALKKLGEDKGGIHLVLFGKQTSDGESGHMTAEVAAWLGVPSVTSVRKIVEISDSEIVVERLTEDGVDTLKLKLPAVVGVTKEINEPRLPSLRGKMAARKAQVPKWGAAELGIEAGAVGKSGSLTEVVDLSPVPSRPAGAVIPGETPEEKAKHLAEKLKEAKLV